MKDSVLKWGKKYHKWPALIISLFLILFVLSGIVMNHRNFFSRFDVNRKFLPEAYKLKIWNLGSVKSAIKLKDGRFLIYGNIGIWQTDSMFSAFSDFNAGFPKGMDMRKVRVVKQTPSGDLIAGTYFGLYKYSLTGNAWVKLELPGSSKRIQDIVCLNHKVFVLTRSEIITFDGGNAQFGRDAQFGRLYLKAPEGYNKKVSLFRFIWISHSGEIAGIAGRLFLDLLGLIIILLVLTGLIYFFIPKVLRRVKSKSAQLADFRRGNLRLHNKAGAWFFVFLILVPLTGMFLRPPFLIPIANANIPVLPLKSLGKDNPWEDKLRAMVWSEETGKFIISTSDGFYKSDSLFSEPPVRFENEPPVSVMGINVLEPCGDGSYYVGSFDGLFRWNPSNGRVINVLQPENQETRQHRGAPSGNLISGMILQEGNAAVFDYDQGVLTVDGTAFPGMPDEVKANSPMALWNVAQEIHTGRIYQPLLGPFYILIVPLVGILSILVFITGYIRWRKIFRKP